MQMNLFTRQKQTHRFGEELMVARGTIGRSDRESDIDMYTLLYLKRETNKVLLCSTVSSTQCYAATWMGGKFGREWIQVYV